MQSRVSRAFRGSASAAPLASSDIHPRIACSTSMPVTAPKPPPPSDYLAQPCGSNDSEHLSDARGRETRRPAGSTVRTRQHARFFRGNGRSASVSRSLRCSPRRGSAMGWRVDAVCTLSGSTFGAAPPACSTPKTRSVQFASGPHRAHNATQGLRTDEWHEKFVCTAKTAPRRIVWTGRTTAVRANRPCSTRMARQHVRWAHDTKRFARRRQCHIFVRSRRRYFVRSLDHRTLWVCRTRLRPFPEINRVHTRRGSVVFRHAWLRHRGIDRFYYILRASELAARQRISNPCAAPRYRRGYRPTQRPRDVASELQHSRIDLMKMDIEGSEYATIEDLARTSMMGSIDQICIEFHHRFKTIGMRQTTDAIQRLAEGGFQIAWVCDRGEDFLFIRGEFGGQGSRG